MLAKLKLLAYIVLIPLVAWFAWGFYSNYSFVEQAAQQEDGLAFHAHSKAILAEPETRGPSATAPDSTNSSALTNLTEISTNLVAGSPGDGATNELVSTNTDLSSNLVVATTVKHGKTKKKAKATHDLVKHTAQEKLDQDEHLDQAQKSMAKCLVGLILASIGLGGLIAYDATSYFANRGVDMIFDDDNESGKDPEYERAEQIWADGRPMEAIEVMRGYLKRNPREQYVALRIAEIYERDFSNFLAAALEYEEVLKHKLSPERWAWAAIHLCNLYTKQGRDKDHNKLLERIVREYPKTAAAKKARVRLGIPEGGEIPTEAEDDNAPTVRLKEIPPPEPEAPSNLPRGFRPKK